MDELQRAAYQRARGRANGGRPRARIYAAVLAPDPLICGLCGERIDKRLPRNHPWSKTVDHILAIIDGGAELDPDNLQPSHRLCNGLKEAERRRGVHAREAERLYAPTLMKPLIISMPRAATREIVEEAP